MCAHCFLPFHHCSFISLSLSLSLFSLSLQIDELFKKIGGRFKVSWADAVRALSETELDVDEAYYTVQRYGLMELYDYLMSDFSKVTEGKTEMEYLKNLIIERMKQKDSEDVYNVSL